MVINKFNFYLLFISHLFINQIQAQDYDSSSIRQWQALRGQNFAVLFDGRTIVTKNVVFKDNSFKKDHLWLDRDTFIYKQVQFVQTGDMFLANTRYYNSFRENRWREADTSGPAHWFDNGAYEFDLMRGGVRTKSNRDLFNVGLSTLMPARLWLIEPYAKASPQAWEAFRYQRRANNWITAATATGSVLTVVGSVGIFQAVVNPNTFLARNFPWTLASGLLLNAAAGTGRFILRKSRPEILNLYNRDFRDGKLKTPAQF